ncbi:M30 family zinc metallopeptidase [Pigmentiphaga kullae]|uniref:Peptidase M30-like protein n=1 Tax=Pigmentiphaga kullae TaxID=151784 RepID=A0A4Q7NDJ9_9BURK|nr:hypothetical protein [Pigmentiphaga kullae]RZS81132.1 peptidase M30-like protein [Pigmentiphaga kullae]
MTSTSARTCVPIRSLAIHGVWLLLAACGGDGDQALPAPPVVPPAASLAVDCAGPHCGAIAPDRYDGQGIGLWQYTNDTDERVALPIRIAGIPGKDVQLIYASHSDTPQKLPALELFVRSPYPGAALASTLNGLSLRAGQPSTFPTIRHGRIPEAMWRKFRAQRQISPQLRAAPDVRVPPQVGDRRNWWIDSSVDEPDSIRSRPATLRKQVMASGIDPRRVNFWVADPTEGPDLITDGMLDQLAQRVLAGDDSSYARLVALAGPLWGPSPYENVIPPDQDLHIVIADGLASGGYVDLLNVLRRDMPTGIPEIDEWLRFSNEAIAAVLHAASVYDPLGPVGYGPSTLMHELTHAATAYGRDFSRTISYANDTWLEEMVATMMQDVQFREDLDSKHSIRDDRLASWLRLVKWGSLNCDLRSVSASDFTQACYGYDRVGSFGAFLLRQFGVAFFHGLLQNTSSRDSFEVLDDAIRQAGGAGFAQAWQRFSTIAALLPATNVPTGFGMPARKENGYALVPMDGARYAVSELPTATPMQLAPYGIFPFVRPGIQGTYRETVTVPPHTSLSVVIR